MNKIHFLEGRRENKGGFPLQLGHIIEFQTRWPKPTKHTRENKHCLLEKNLTTAVKDWSKVICEPNGSNRKMHLTTAESKLLIHCGRKAIWILERDSFCFCLLWSWMTLNYIGRILNNNHRVSVCIYCICVKMPLKITWRLGIIRGLTPQKRCIGMKNV